MGKLLLFAFVMLGMIALAVCVTAWSAWRWLRRRNEVSVAHPTRPPLRWLVSPEPCARLHRRLATAVIVVRHAVPSTRRRRRREKEPVAALAADIETRAVALDHDLMIVVHLRGDSSRAVRQRIATQVDMIERIAHRLAITSSRSGDAAPTIEAVRRITEYLDALDAARAEIAQIERDAGLVLPI